MGTTGIIFDIKHFAIHDGPGIRTTVFLKGCPLGCLWCHNPESISAAPQLLFNPRKCIGCGQCYQVCPNNVHKMIGTEHIINRDACQLCGKCVEECYAGALEMAGYTVTVDQVLEEVLQDRIFYENSGGGLTLSGGDPLAQFEFSLALLKAAKKEGIHTALDTSGQTEWKKFEKLLEFTDLVLYDIKHMDSDRHRALTGVPNELIVENLRRLGDYEKRIWIRIPLIPGKNDDDRNFHAIGELLSSLRNVERIEVLKYHRLAESKYQQMGKEYSLIGLNPPSDVDLESRLEVLREHGLSKQIAV